MAGPRYMVGPAYRAGGVWRYPAEDFQLDATGLAEVLPDRTGLTTDGEAYDGSAMAAAHPTLQLPAIIRVTSLKTGRQILLRVNDRGPANPGRLLGLTRAAARLLDIPPDGIGQVRVQVESEPSQTLRDALSTGPKAVTAAPRVTVTAEALAAPRGVIQSPPTRAVSARSSAASKAMLDAVPDRLPGAVTQVAPAPGQLWIRAGEFGLRAYADQVSARLGGVARVEVGQAGRGQVFRVRAGPYADVPAADSALDRAVRAGVTDARIVVE